MPSPFPGMDPYLEHPSMWPEVHHRLISAIADALEQTLTLDYRVAIEKRTYLSVPEDSVLVGIPDVSVYHKTERNTATAVIPETRSASVTVTLPMPEEVKEGYLELRDIATGEVVTAIEVLSPTNKRAGPGLNAYQSKRQTVLSSRTHLVEIDLLRGGETMPMLGTIAPSDYRILVSRSTTRPRAELYGFNLEEPIPVVGIPLKAGAAEVTLDLQTLLAGIYDRARYALSIDYNQTPIPPIRQTAQAWTKEQINNQIDGSSMR
ncbi:MAG: DUF4058 family protein [Alkalinema sp. RU_4_3]|nr:DUF4058 family protein [Alkalinema sp. RU_4_3]